MRCIVYLFCLLILISSVSAATIHGSIYDLSLDKVQNVVVEINTQPKQQFIAKDGVYSFTVPPGEYVIEAAYYLDNVIDSSAKEEITVKAEGDFILDLILFPVIDSELIEEGEEINLEEDYFKEKNYLPVVLVVLFVVVLLILYFIIKKKVKKKEAKEEVSKKEEDYYDKVLSLIKENKRVTQKEIRKQIPLSEAKISLIITELEHKGLIEKIKKGRGNILILKR